MGLIKQAVNYQKMLKNIQPKHYLPLGNAAAGGVLGSFVGLGRGIDSGDQGVEHLRNLLIGGLTGAALGAGHGALGNKLLTGKWDPSKQELLKNVTRMTKILMTDAPIKKSIIRNYIRKAKNDPSTRKAFSDSQIRNKITKHIQKQDYLSRFLPTMLFGGGYPFAATYMPMAAVDTFNKEGSYFEKKANIPKSKILAPAIGALVAPAIPNVVSGVQYRRSPEFKMDVATALMSQLVNPQAYNSLRDFTMGARRNLFQKQREHMPSPLTLAGASLLGGLLGVSYNDPKGDLGLLGSILKDKFNKYKPKFNFKFRKGNVKDTAQVAKKLLGR